MADAGGFNLGGGYVEIDVDLSPARAKMEAFKGEIQNYFAGAVVAPVGAAGVAPSAASGGVASPAGGGGTAASFQGLPAVASPQQIGIQMSPGIAVGGATAGGSDILSAREGTAAVKEAAQELANALRGAASAVGGGGPSLGPVGWTGGGVDSALPSINPDLTQMMRNGGAGARNYYRYARSQNDQFADPAEMYSAPPSPMGLGAMEGGIERNTYVPGPRQSAQFSRQMGVLDDPSMGGDEFPLGAVPEGNASAYARYRRTVSGESPAGGGNRAGVGGFGVFGAVSRGTGIPYAGVIAAAYAFHMTSNVVQHVSDADPQLAADQLYQPGAEYNLQRDPIAVRAAQDVASSRMWQGVWGEIPGGNLVMSATGYSRSAHLQQLRNQQIISGRAYEGAATFSQSIESAVATGNRVDVAEAENAQRLAPFYGKGISYEAFAEQKRINDQILANAQTELGGFHTSQLLNILGSEQSISASTETSAAIGQRRDNPLSMLRGRLNALPYEQAATLSNFEAETTRGLSQIHNVAEQFRFSDQRMAGYRALVAGQGVAMQSAREDLAEAEIEQSASMFRERQSFELGLMQTRSDVARAGEEQWLRNSVSTLTGRSSLQAAMGNRWAAAATSLSARRQAAVGAPTVAEQMRLNAGIDVDERIVNMEHAFQSQLFGESIDTRIGAAGDEVNLMPMAAQARRDVASARREIANTPTEDGQRARVTEAVQSELRATGYLLTAQRGGQTAIDVRGNVAMGMLAATGVDLSGHMRDVQEAQKRYSTGADNASTAPERKDEGPTRSQMDKVIQWIGQWKPSAVSFLSPR